MKDWRQIISDIEDALSDYNVEVEFQRKLGHGFDATCSYFTVWIEDEDWDWDYVESDIQSVCDEWDLEIDFDSAGDFDLNAHWDIND